MGGPLPSPKIVPIRPSDRALVRFRWMAEVLASPEYTDADARVLMRLALFQNIETGRLFASNAKLAKGSNQSDRQVRRTIEKAEQLGMVTRVVHRGRGKANNYNLKNRNVESGFFGKPDSGVREPPSKTGLRSPPNREVLTERESADRLRPTMDELAAKYPDLLKRIRGPP